jgi:hypothetical protein
MIKQSDGQRTFITLPTYYDGSINMRASAKTSLKCHGLPALLRFSPQQALAAALIYTICPATVNVDRSQ